MKLLADASLPALIEEPNASGVQIDRFTGDAVSDTDLVAYAAAQGYVAVVFLSRNGEADERLVASAQAAGVTGITTVSEKPTEAAHQILARLSDIADLIPTNRWIVVMKNGPRVDDE